MTEAKKLGRRGFLGVSAATVGAGLGVGLVGLKAAATARFVAPNPFPEAPVAVDLAFPEAPRGAFARVWMHIRTPEGSQTRDLGRVRLRDGRATLETQLFYPFEGRVPGDYAYYVEAACQGRRAVTEAPATYAVRKIWWLS